VHESDDTEGLRQELKKSYENLELFSKLATRMQTLQLSDEALRNLLTEVCDAVGVGFAATLVTDRQEFSAHVSSDGFEEHVGDADWFARELLKCITHRIQPSENNCYLVKNSHEVAELCHVLSQPFRALAVRIDLQDLSHGWVLLCSFDLEQEFRPSDCRLVYTVSQQIALLFNNADFHRELETFVVDIVKTLVVAIEARGAYTEGHSERVCEYALALGNALNLSHSTLGDLRWASLLHDVGFIKTPDSILNKTDPLSDEELALIREHPDRGVQILAPIVQLAGSLDAIRHHHEKYDGSGYPERLSGHDIPLLARIIGIAEAYVAITSERAYRPALSREDALAALQTEAGRHFDPQLVDTFVKAVPTVRARGGVD